MRDLVKGSFLEGAPIVAVSARTGAGLDLLRAELARTAARVPAPHQTASCACRSTGHSRCRGFGTVVTGTLVSGDHSADDTLESARGGRRKSGPAGARSRGCRGVAGQRTAVNLAGWRLRTFRAATCCARPAFEPTRRADLQVKCSPDARR